MENNSIKKNAILNITYNIVNIIFPLITFPYVSRILKAENLGSVTFFSSIANYAIMLASLGVSTYGIRAVSRVRDDKKELSQTAYELFVINSISSLFIIVLLLLSSVFIKKFSSEPILLLINCVLILATPFGMNWLLSGMEQYGYITKRSIAVKLISLVMVFLLVKKSEDYCVYAAIITFSTVGAYILNFLYSLKIVNLKNIRKIEYKKHIKPMMILFASSLAVSVYINLDTIMLGFICGDKQVGLYTVAIKVKSMLLIAVNAISTVLLPRLSYYLAHDRWRDFRKILEKSISTIVLISVPLVFFFMIEAEDSVLFLGGAEYLDATLCMTIIMPILFISGISNITGNQVLIPLGKEDCFMKAVVSGAIIDLILNFFLMPRWGCVGAAIATLVAECTQLSIQMFFSKKYVLPTIHWKTIIKIIVSCLCASFVIFLFHDVVNCQIFVNLLIYAIIFFTIYGLVLVLLKEELLLEYMEYIRYRLLNGEKKDVSG